MNRYTVVELAKIWRAAPALITIKGVCSNGDWVLFYAYRRDPTNYYNLVTKRAVAYTSGWTE